MDLSKLSKDIFCKFPKILRRPRGSAPRTPYEAGHNLEPSKFSCVRQFGMATYLQAFHSRVLSQSIKKIILKILTYLLLSNCNSIPF